MLKQLQHWLGRKRSNASLPASLCRLFNEGRKDFEANRHDEVRRRLLPFLARRDEIENLRLFGPLLSILCTTWLCEDQYGAAIEFFSDYIRSYPDDALGYHHRALALWYEGQLEHAVQDFSRVLESTSDNTLMMLALSGRGKVFAEHGEFEKALEDLDRASVSLNLHAMWYAQSGKMDRAFIRNGRGAALTGLGRFDLALEAFARSIHLCPDNAWAYYNRAHAYELLGVHDKAIADYELALSKQNPKLTLTKAAHAEARIQSFHSSR